MEKEKNELNVFDAVLQTAMNALDEAKKTEVFDIDSASSVKETGLELKKIENEAEGIRKSLVKPYNDQVKKINAYAKEILNPVIDAKVILRDRLHVWQQKENARIQEENRIAQEKRQKEIDAEDERVAKEEARRREEAEKTALEKDEKVKEIEEVETKEIEPVTFSQNVNAVQTRTVWKFDVVDLSIVPREFFKLDETLIRKAVVSDRVREIPGIKIYSEEHAVMR